MSRDRAIHGADRRRRLGGALQSPFPGELVTFLRPSSADGAKARTRHFIGPDTGWSDWWTPT